MFGDLKQKSGVKNIIRSRVNVQYDDDKEYHDEKNSNDEITRHADGVVEGTTTLDTEHM